MGMPGWWDERRLGLFVHANLATVPAWAPIGQYADWYRSHLGDEVADVLLHPQPMVEVLAHHRDRWGHIEQFDDFLPLLTFDRFDAESWARLAVDAGAGYTVLVAKHHDGLAWWDAPGSTRSVLDGGPQRNVLAEYASACERNDVVFGTYYSLLDWADGRYPGDGYVSDVLHPDVVDLVERYGSSVLWGDGHWGAGPDRWRTAELLERIRTLDTDVVVNDRWWADESVPAGSPEIVRTFEYAPPADIVDGPWELCRGIGASFCHNRAERAEHHLSGRDIVALLTEVVAKGGNLLLNVGPAADGTIPELQAAPLREAGTWIRRHDRLLARARPWEVWGDDEVRYWSIDGELHAVDLSGRASFAALTDARARVRAVTALDGEASDDPSGDVARTVGFAQDGSGLRLETARPALDRRFRGTDPLAVAVYRIELADVDAPVTLFEPTPREPVELAPLVEGARPGVVVQLADGFYRGPALVPAGVTVRGAGNGRTIVEGDGATAVTLERDARLEHVAVRDGPARLAWLPSAAVVVAGRRATVVGCRIDGHVVVAADDATVRATAAAGVRAEGVDRVTVSRCEFTGMRWDVGVDVIGGGGHDVDSCDVHDHLCAIRLTDTAGAVVRGNQLSARWWGVHLVRTEGAHVYGNFVQRTMRGIDIEGGTQALVDGNAVCDGDSGCIVEWGASDCQVSGNRWERCRIGVLAWEAGDVIVQGNEATDLHEPDAAFTTGP